MPGKGFILSLPEIPSRTGLTGHPNMNAYRFLNTAGQALRPGEESSLHLMVTLDVIQPGGGVEEHHHTEAPVFDHGYYVISGKIRATIGGKTKVVGRDTLIYCPSNVKHEIVNVGRGVARVLRLAASGAGDNLGKLVFTKPPSNA